jgi:hypothetical protein
MAGLSRESTREMGRFPGSIHFRAGLHTFEVHVDVHDLDCSVGRQLPNHRRTRQRDPR